MDLDEKTAKKVLDFLARKIGYDEFMIDDVSDPLCTRYATAVVKYKSKHEVDIFHLFKDKAFFTASSTDDYARTLKSMLDASKDGFEITTLGEQNVFLPAYATIEQLEIMLDLDAIPT